MFPNQVHFLSPGSQNNRKAEYILRSEQMLSADFINSALNGHGISHITLMRNSSRTVHQNIKENMEEGNWPATPQEIIESTSLHNPATFNSVAWMINPDASIGENGLVKVAKNKETKISKICQDIESLMPNAIPSYDQLLLSLTLHRKTGSSDVVDIINDFGHGVPYTEVRFVEDKWAQWDEEQSSIIPSNMVKGVHTTHVADNIDWKNKSQSG